MRIPRFVALALLCTPSACTDPGGDDTGTGINTTSGNTGSTGASTPTTSATGTGDTGNTGDTGDTGDTGWTPASCFDGWDELETTYPDTGAPVDCAEVPGGYAVVRALLVRAGPREPGVDRLLVGAGQPRAT